jgi:sialidase-1
MGSAAVDEVTGRIFLMCGGGWLQSSDNGNTWQDWKPRIIRPEDGLPGSTHGSGPGITLEYGRHKGRIVWPARTVDKRQGYDDRKVEDRQTKCYSTVLYSDDHGQTIHRGPVFLQGTGEACLVERLNGEIFLNARAYHNDNCRYAAVSRDGGVSFVEIGPVPDLRETLQGCNASMMRYPPEWIGGQNCILFANPDSVQWERFNGTLRVSWDEGETWHLFERMPHKEAWFGYSSMVVTNDQFILLMYRSHPKAYLSTLGRTISSSMVAVRLNSIKLMS